MNVYWLPVAARLGRRRGTAVRMGASDVSQHSQFARRRRLLSIPDRTRCREAARSRDAAPPLYDRALYNRGANYLLDVEVGAASSR